ncbi:MAG: hypothetical protein R3Y58_06665 [Eubacteriales bacterium]
MKKLNENESNAIPLNAEELELEQILKEIENDEELRNVTVPESVTKKLYAQIAAYEAAVVDIEPAEELSLEERFPNMTAEERAIFQEALEAKKLEATKDEVEEAQTEETDNVIRVRKRKKKTKKALLLVAAIFILSMAMGTVGFGERFKWLQVNEKEMGSDGAVTIDSEDDMILTQIADEKAAYDYAKEVLGMDVVPIVDYCGMLEFQGIDGYEGSKIVEILYTYGDYTVLYRMLQNGYKTSHYEVMTGELVDEYDIEKHEVCITVQKYLEENGKYIFSATFTYNNIFYTLQGMVNEEDFLVLLDELFFSE